MITTGPVRNVASPPLCGRITNKTTPVDTAVTVPMIPGPRHDLLGRLIVTDRSIATPARVGDIIGPDPARWLAAIMRLPVEHVRAKLAAVRP